MVRAQISEPVDELVSYLRDAVGTAVENKYSIGKLMQRGRGDEKGVVLNTYSSLTKQNKKFWEGIYLSNLNKTNFLKLF